MTVGQLKRELQDYSDDDSVVIYDALLDEDNSLEGDINTIHFADSLVNAEHFTRWLEYHGLGASEVVVIRFK